MTETSTGPAPERVVGRPASAKAAFYIDWGMETIKGSAAVMTDALQRVITLGTALTGGGFAAAAAGVVPFWWAVAALACLVGSVAAAAWGVYPVGAAVNALDPAAVEAFQGRAVAHKTRWLGVAFALLVAGLAVALAGLASTRL